MIQSLVSPSMELTFNVETAAVNKIMWIVVSDVWSNTLYAKLKEN